MADEPATLHLGSVRQLRAALEFWDDIDKGELSGQPFDRPLKLTMIDGYLRAEVGIFTPEVAYIDHRGINVTDLAKKEFE